MHLEVADNPDEQRYEVRAGGELAGYVTYHRRGNRIALNHTEVLDAFEGKGVGSALAARTLDDARARGLEVLPFCPFVRGYIERHPAYVDLVPEGDRERFRL